jgi:hypothetical protein
LDWVDVLNLVSIVAPILIVFHFLFIQHVSHLSDSVANFKDNVLSLYFSHYRPEIFNGYIVRSGLKILLFFISYVLIVMTTYMFTIFLISYIFGVNTKHADTLLILIALAVASIRILVHREGGQKAEIFSWLISILLICWLLVGYATHFFETVKPLLSGYTSLLKHFSENHLIKETLIDNLPKNPIVILLGFLTSVVIEIVSIIPIMAERLAVVPCNAWVLCHEVVTDMTRINGTKYILKKAEELLEKCEEDQISPIWVTETYHRKIVDKMRTMNIPSASIIILCDNCKEAEITSDWAKKGFKIFMHPNGYHTDFLLVPKKGVLIFTRHPTLKDIPEPTIGYYSTDIYLLQKYESIFKELKDQSHVFSIDN